MNFLISSSWAGFPVRQAHFPAPDNARIRTAQPLTSDNQIPSDDFHRPELVAPASRRLLSLRLSRRVASELAFLHALAQHHRHVTPHRIHHSNQPLRR